MKKKNSTYLIILLLGVALVASLALVVKNQEVRKGAFAGGQMYLLDHTTPIEAEVGDDVDVQVYVESTEEAKVSQVRAVLCYGSEISLRDEKSVKSNVEANTTVGFSSDNVIAIKTTKGDKDCINFTLTSQQTEDVLKSGAVRIAKVKFEAVVAGEGEIEMDGSKSKVVGVNPGEFDKVIDINQFYGRAYVVTEPSEEPASTPIPVSTSTPIPLPQDGLVLNFKTSFNGLRNANTVCGQNWPVDLMVMGDGETLVYTGVVLSKTKEKIASGEVVFATGLKLGEFGHADNLAVFLRGPMHLQMKYGKDGQDDFYGKAGFM